MAGENEIKPTGIMRRGAFDPKSLDETARTVEVVFATDSQIKMYNWRVGEYEEILVCEESAVRAERLKSGMPVIDNHDTWQGAKGVLGVVESYKFANGEGRAVIRFSKTEDVEPIWQNVKDGILRGISCGYRVHKYQDMNPLRAENELPLYKAIDWEPMEISIAPVQADPKSTVRNAGENADFEIITTRKNLKPNNMAEEIEPKNPVEGERKPASTPATPPAPVNTVDADAVRREATEAERSRVRDIRDAVRTAGLGDEFATELIDNGSSVDSARAAIIKKWAENDPNKGQRTNAAVVADEADSRRSAMVDALILRAAPELMTGINALPADRVEAARSYRGMTLLEIARECLTRAGVNTSGMSKMEIAGRAFTQSTSDFPVLLEGTNRRVLLAAYSAVADTWRRFCITGNVGDFRDYSRLRMGSFSNLDEVGENAEFKNKAIPDAEYEKIRAKTKGNIINVSRQMIVNDDLGAFTRLASMLGRAAARSIEADVYALLLSNSGNGPTMADGKALFHADHGNIGTGSALSVTGLDADRVLMAQQKDPSGNDYLDIRPSLLLVPIGLGSAAKILNTSVYDPDATNKLQKPNSVNGMFSDIIDTPRLTGTARYLFASPSEEPVLEVAFLDGMQSPFLESQEGFRVDGIEWKVRMDYGVGAVGWRGVVKNAGA